MQNLIPEIGQSEEWLIKPSPINLSSKMMVNLRYEYVQFLQLYLYLLIRVIQLSSMENNDNQNLYDRLQQKFEIAYRQFQDFKGRLTFILSLLQRASQPNIKAQQLSRYLLDEPKVKFQRGKCSECNKLRQRFALFSYFDRYFTPLAQLFIQFKLIHIEHDPKSNLQTQYILSLAQRKAEFDKLGIDFYKFQKSLGNQPNSFQRQLRPDEVKCHHEDKYLSFLNKWLSNIKQFQTISRLQFKNIRKLRLNYCKLGDLAIKQLSQLPFKNAEQVSLIGNEISTFGLGHLILSKFDKTVAFDLNRAKISGKKYKYVIQPGKSITLLKQCISHDNTSIDQDKFLQIYKKQKSGLFQALHLMLSIPFQQVLDVISPQALQSICQEYDVKVKSLVRGMQYLVQLLKPFEVKIVQKKNIYSQFSKKILFSSMYLQMIKFKYLYRFKNHTLEQLKQEQKLLLDLQKEVLLDLRQNYKLQVEQIDNIELGKEQVQVYFSLDLQTIDTWSNNKLFQAALENNKLRLIPYFQSFALSLQDFLDPTHPKHNVTYQNQTEKQYRGGLPYFKPKECNSYGLDVLDRYDKKKLDVPLNRWIEKNGLKGEWSVFFYPLIRPDYFYKGNNQLTKLKEIMRNLRQGQGLKKGEGSQKYKDEIALNRQDNKQDNKVGYGITCSPLYTTALKTATPCTRNEETKCIVLQVRGNPQAVKYTREKGIVVINQSYDIRPYSIILAAPKSREELKKIQRPEELEDVIWESVKQTLSRFLSQK